MIDFIVKNISTIIVSVILALVVALAVMKLHKDKKAGKSACGCKCSGCPNSSMCHMDKKEK